MGYYQTLQWQPAKRASDSSSLANRERASVSLDRRTQEGGEIESQRDHKNSLWGRHFATIAELTEALHEFRRRYNRERLVERHRFRSLAQFLWDLTAPIPAVA
jgi:hypothetical protein